MSHVYRELTVGLNRKRLVSELLSTIPSTLRSSSSLFTNPDQVFFNEMFVGLEVERIGNLML